MATATTSIRIAKGSINHRACARACQIVRRIKNQTLYLIKNNKTAAGKAFTHSDADKYLKQNNRDLYDRLPAAISQRSTIAVGDSVSSYYAAIAEYKIAPHKFKARAYISGLSPQSRYRNDWAKWVLHQSRCA